MIFVYYLLRSIYGTPVSHGCQRVKRRAALRFDFIGYLLNMSPRIFTASLSVVEANLEVAMIK